jgi:hypothetical protein
MDNKKILAPKLGDYYNIRIKNPVTGEECIARFKCHKHMGKDRFLYIIEDSKDYIILRKYAFQQLVNAVPQSI